MRTYKIDGPTHWASYLINGDRSGLDYFDEDEKNKPGTEVSLCEKWLRHNNIREVIDVSEDSHFTYLDPYGLYGDASEYTCFLNPAKKVKKLRDKVAI